MKPLDPTQLPAAEAARAIRAGRLTAEALVAACLERIVDGRAPGQGRVEFQLTLVG